MKKLKHEDKSAIRLHYIKGKTLKEIGKIYNVSASTINYTVNNKTLEVKKKLQKVYIEENKEKIKEYHKNYQQEMKKKIVEFYSNGENRCDCCGENKMQFLSVDHINGDGNIHRKTIGNGLYSWLIRNNLPSGFRILCMNCNHSYGHYNMCPHKI